MVVGDISFLAPAGTRGGTEGRGRLQHSVSGWSTTEDAADESLIPGGSRAQTRRRLEEERALLVDEARRRRASCRDPAMLLIGEDTCADADRLLQRAIGGEPTLCALRAKVRVGLARVRAARVLQAAVRLRLGRGLWHVDGRLAPPSIDADTGRAVAYAPVVRPGSAEMWAVRFATQVRKLQRLRHGLARAREVHVFAATKRTFPLRLWARVAVVPMGARSCAPGWKLVFASSLEMARTHAARRVQFAFRWTMLLRAVRRLVALRLRLDEMGAARKADRAASRARALRARAAAAGTSDSRVSQPDIERVYSGAGRHTGTVPPAPSEAASLCWWRGWALRATSVALVAAALLVVGGAYSAAVMGGQTPMPQGGHLPRPPGVRFGDWERPWSDTLQTQQRWLHSCQPDAQDESITGRQCQRSGWREAGDVFDEARIRSVRGRLLCSSSQPMSSCEWTRLAAGPWALPRPPEMCLASVPAGRAGLWEAGSADRSDTTGTRELGLSGRGIDGGSRRIGRTVTRLRAKHSCRRGRRTDSFAGQDGGAGGNRRRPRLRGAEVTEAARIGLHITTAEGERRAQGISCGGDDFDAADSDEVDGDGDERAMQDEEGLTRRRRLPAGGFTDYFLEELVG